MEYEYLKKIYHMNYDRFKEIYNARISSESTHKLDILINKHECFYMINESILKLIDGIYLVNENIDKIINYPIFSSLIKQRILLTTMIEEIRSTNQIEGLHTTRKQIQELLNNKSSKKYKRFSGIVNKYQKLIIDQNLNITTCNDIRKLYDDTLLQDIVKEDIKDQVDGTIFRKNGVIVNKGGKEIHRGVCGEDNIIEMMNKALLVLNDENINILIRVAVFHYIFEYIHPFYNGNVPLRYQQQIAA